MCTNKYTAWWIFFVISLCTCGYLHSLDQLLFLFYQKNEFMVSILGQTWWLGQKLIFWRPVAPCVGTSLYSRECPASCIPDGLYTAGSLAHWAQLSCLVSWKVFLEKSLWIESNGKGTPMVLCFCPVFIRPITESAQKASTSILRFPL